MSDLQIKEATVTVYEVEGKTFTSLEEAQAFLNEQKRVGLVDKFVFECLTAFKPRTQKRMREVLLDWEVYKANEVTGAPENAG
jgi:hypothetical protein